MPAKVVRKLAPPEPSGSAMWETLWHTGVEAGLMKTYSFKVVVEPDGERWHAYCPALLRRGAATWGYSREEALSNIEEVVKMVVQSLIEHGEPLPTEPCDQVRLSPDPEVAVIV